MTSAEIIAIGTELLLGEIQDTNTRDLAIFLKETGIDLYRTTIIGDNPHRIAGVIQEALSRADIVVTAGGLGPTVDDPTREAVAAAVGVSTYFSEELWEQIQNRFNRFGRTATANNKKQAYIPEGAIPVENNVGTAPAFIVEVGSKAIICLPGVPRELQYLLKAKVQPYLEAKYIHREFIQTRILHVAGMGESQVDELISDLETSLNPTVGLSAHPGQVDVRITAKGKDQAAVTAMLAEMAAEVRQRLGKRIFGENSDTLEKVVVQKLKNCQMDIKIIHHGLGNRLTSRLVSAAFSAEQIEQLDEPIFPDTLATCISLAQTMIDKENSSILVVCLFEDGERQRLYLHLSLPEHQQSDQLSYGGPPELSRDWAANQALDFLRRNLS